MRNRSRPASVQRAIGLLYLAFGIGALSVFLALSAGPPALPGVNNWIVYGPVALIYIANLLLIVMIHMRQDWARFVYALVTAFGCWASVSLLLHPGQVAAVLVLLVSSAIQVAAMVLLYGKEATDWFYQSRVDDRRNGGFPASASGFAASARRFTPVAARRAGPSEQDVSAHSRWRAPVTAVNSLLILLTLGSAPLAGIGLFIQGWIFLMNPNTHYGGGKLLLGLCTYLLYLGLVLAAILKWLRAGHLRNTSRDTFMWALAPLPVFVFLICIPRLIPDDF